MLSNPKPKTENLEQILEALLFAYGESLSLKKLSEVTKNSLAEVGLALANLKKTLARRGIKLLEKNDYWQLATDKSASDYIEKLIKSEIQEELTPASLEVLAVVAYRGPLAKSELEMLRGVNSAYALRNLTLRGLVEKNENIKPPTYQISLAALKKLGLAGEHELPRYHELKTETTRVETLLSKNQ
ncbi:MAG: SMC-Scp complex subunit ScpB [Patescibacteria group bacterium]